MANFIYPPIAVTIAGGATEAKQDDAIALLTTIDVDTSDIAVDTGTIAADTTVIAADTTSIDGKINVCDTDDVTVTASALPSGASTAALQTAANALLTAIDLDTSAIAVSVALIDGKITTCNTGDVTIAASALPSGASTAALQTAGNALLTAIDLDTSSISTTNSSIDGKITACNTGDVTIAASALPSGASTAALQTSSEALLTTIDADTSNIASDISDLNDRLAGNLVPAAFDYIALTYVAAGDGAGEIETVVYKTGGSGGTTQATLTLAYDASDKLASVTKA